MLSSKYRAKSVPGIELQSVTRFRNSLVQWDCHSFLMVLEDGLLM